MGICQLCGLDALFIRGIQFAVSYVIHDCSCEQMCILKNYTKTSSEIRLPYLAYVDIVIPYLAVLYIIKPVYQIGYGRLARACTSDKCNLLTRLCIHIYVVQNYLIRIVTKVNILKFNLTCELSVCNLTCLMLMSPCPETGSLLGLREIAICILLCIYQLNIALVLLRLLVCHGKYPVSSGSRHNYGIDLLAYLGYRHRKALVERQKCHKGSYGKP